MKPIKKLFMQLVGRYTADAEETSLVLSHLSLKDWVSHCEWTSERLKATSLPEIKSEANV